MAMACRYNPTLYTTRNRTSFCHTNRVSIISMAATPNPKRFPVLTMAASLRPISLIGPPEIYQKPAPGPGPTPAATTTEKSDPFMDLLVANYNNVVFPPMGLTENGSPTFLSSGNPCLDFFFHVVPNTPPETLIQFLQRAWEHDPLKALKLVCNLRGVRGTGKSDRQGAYTAALWLHQNHPKTLACNVDKFADFGYSKDLVEILFRLLEGPDVRRLSKVAHRQWLASRQRSKRKKKQLKMRLKTHGDDDESHDESEEYDSDQSGEEDAADSEESDDENRESEQADNENVVESDKNDSENLENLESDEYDSDQSDEEDAADSEDSDDENESEQTDKEKEQVVESDKNDSELTTEKGNNVESNEGQPKPTTYKSVIWEAKRKLKRGEKRVKRAKRVVERFYSDPDFKFLHEQVSDYFSRCLRSDLKMLSAGEIFQISLAAKWCPSLDSTYDEVTLLCETIAKKVFPRDEYPEYQGVEEAHYAYRVRDRLRKEVLVPLRKELDLPEVYICAKDWGSIPYGRVASVAMSLYKSRFIKNDGERFQEYLGKVEKGEATIAAGALLPHEIIGALNDDDDNGQVAELQWRRMVEDMSKKGKLNNCLAVSDVSSSMSGIPMEVSVALGVLVSELSEEPWKGKLITFSANPQLQTVCGNSLKEKTDFVRGMEWGSNTDFQKVFDLLLRVAVDGKLKPEHMIKRLFVFSDMEFDQASKPYACSHYYHYHDEKLHYVKNDQTDRSRTWETDYEAIVRKFTEKGYGECVPEIVFWNLRDSRATPVPAKQPGVALVSGFSKNLMTVFLEEGGILNPEGVMDIAISGEEYQKLELFD